MTTRSLLTPPKRAVSRAIQAPAGCRSAHSRARAKQGVVMLGIPLGLLYANAGEWLIHKYVLHGLGKKKGSFFSFHWAEHHRACRKHEFFDPDYRRSMFGKHAQGKEALAIAALMVAHAPLLPVAPLFTATVWYSAVNYFIKHRKAHLDPEWAKRHLKHHFDHHMGREQDANWCVTQPWFDFL